MSEQGFTLTSPAYFSGRNHPAAFTCDGENTSPELKWMHPPDGTRSFVLIVDDPDAPNGTFTHWVLFDIPADRKKPVHRATKSRMRCKDTFSVALS